MVARQRVHAALVSLALAAMPVRTHAQTATVEADLTAGYSGEDIRGAATQARVFGETDRVTQIQYFGEVSWGKRWSGDHPVIGAGLFGADPSGTDVFGAAYPYLYEGGCAHASVKCPIALMEAYGERYFRPHRAMLGVRAGQYRTPFGIYGRSDYAYTGFIRPPLIRYDGYFALSNDYLERGVMATAGVPQLFVEASLGRPGDVGTAPRRSGTDESIHVQGYAGPFILGVSHARSEPYLPASFAFGRQEFTGVDWRFAHSSGVQLRGEIFHGHSFRGVTTNGWYADVFVHHVGMGPVTAVARDEAMNYTTPDPARARSAHRQTIGARVRLPHYFTAQANYVHQRGDLPHIDNNTVDVTLTYSFRYR